MMNNQNEIHKQQIGKTIPKCLFVISCNLLSSDFLIKSFMSTPRTHTHDTTLMYILKPYIQV